MSKKTNESTQTGKCTNTECNFSEVLVTIDNNKCINCNGELKITGDVKESLDEIKSKLFEGNTLNSQEFNIQT